MEDALSIEKNALAALVSYLDSHIEWKRARGGPGQRVAKEAMDKAHGVALQAAELYKRQLPKPER